jgi:hypothetical protein
MRITGILGLYPRLAPGSAASICVQRGAGSVISTNHLETAPIIGLIGHGLKLGLAPIHSLVTMGSLANSHS